MYIGGCRVIDKGPRFRACCTTLNRGLGQGPRPQLSPSVRPVTTCDHNPMRPSDLWLTGVLVGAVLGGLTLVDAARFQQEASARLARGAALVERLGLTDLALFTEARYTRHLSQADRFAAFQDHPTALEHFPSGALVGPPGH